MQHFAGVLNNPSNRTRALQIDDYIDLVKH